MLWIVAQDGPPPEGFTIFTTEMGKTVLRRKRQRNLNKVGIGGFSVRVRSQGRFCRNGDSDIPPSHSSDALDSSSLTSTIFHKYLSIS